LSVLIQTHEDRLLKTMKRLMQFTNLTHICSSPPKQQIIEVIICKFSFRSNTKKDILDI